MKIITKLQNFSANITKFCGWYNVDVRRKCDLFLLSYLVSLNDE